MSLVSHLSQEMLSCVPSDSLISEMLSLSLLSHLSQEMLSCVTSESFISGDVELCH